MDDVIPFLTNVLRGRNVPEERMKVVARHYEQFGGVSPINEQNRRLIAALEETFKSKNLNLPVYFGNRNWHPLLADTIGKMKADGIKNVLYFVTSAYGSYSSCRQYRENVDNAIEESGATELNFEKLRLYFNHPGFIEANCAHLEEALQEFQNKDEVMVLFSAHSIPLSMSEKCHYVSQLSSAASLIATRVGVKRFKNIYQSRSGPPTQPWLEPDILDELETLKSEGVRDVVVLPLGFISDHMEVIYDLDMEAKAKSEKLGLNYLRAKTVGIHPKFVEMIYQLILERVEGTQPLFEGELGLLPEQCGTDCCLAPERIAR